jgi:Protein of unknown function (DUF1572).
MSTLEQTVKAHLMKKSAEIRGRMLQAIDQLNDDQINWRFNSECNSIANLVVHIRGMFINESKPAYWATR